jgi:hypothetical protein
MTKTVSRFHLGATTNWLQSVSSALNRTKCVTCYRQHEVYSKEGKPPFVRAYRFHTFGTSMPWPRSALVLVRLGLVRCLGYGCLWSWFVVAADGGGW